ncbi:hypothetical protein B0H15DRAFT_459459 [Mycena belliarum]|uniref:F-box domain-containing protein n=1 Tax=Mycena belliarum TaxID=1033014 RepID=A0AAD6UEP1_9AGAR|nr:hypothetical protein B0H15DRAFT_459459 [Mycena belliae]
MCGLTVSFASLLYNLPTTPTPPQAKMGSMQAPTLTLAALPEELLERILALVVDPALRHPCHHCHRHTYRTPPQISTRIVALLVSRAFYRIARPLLYRTLVLRSATQSRALLRALATHPLHIRSVRTLVLLVPSAADAQVLALTAPTLCALDVTLPSVLTDADSFASPAVFPALRTLAVRKAAGTYLSQSGPRVLLSVLAAIVRVAPLLNIATTTFPISSDPTLAPLVCALANAPRLHTLATPLPALWSPALLSVSKNKALERICLGDGAPSLYASYGTLAYPCPAENKAAQHAPPRSVSSPSIPVPSASFTNACAPLTQPRSPRPLLGTGLFLAAARKHARLAELVREGTPVVGWRGRGWSVGSEAPIGMEEGGMCGREAGMRGREAGVLSRPEAT